MKAAIVKQKRIFTEAARAAALEARRAKAGLPKADAIQVFAVRPDHNSTTFTWEIRRFGAIVLERGEPVYRTSAEAMEAGRHVLALANRPSPARRANQRTH